MSLFKLLIKFKIPLLIIIIGFPIYFIQLKEVSAIEKTVNQSFINKITNKANYNLTGRWSDVSGVSGCCTIEQNGENLTVMIHSQNRGPFRGWYKSSNTIAVSFTDDPGCCEGLITGDGKIIKWSNGSRWIKD